MISSDTFEDGSEGFCTHLPLDSIDGPNDRFLRLIFEFAEDLLTACSFRESEPHCRARSFSPDDYVDLPVTRLLP